MKCVKHNRDTDYTRRLAPNILRIAVFAVSESRSNTEAAVRSFSSENVPIACEREQDAAERLQPRGLIFKKNSISVRQISFSAGGGPLDDLEGLEDLEDGVTEPRDLPLGAEWRVGDVGRFGLRAESVRSSRDRAKTWWRAAKSDGMTAFADSSAKSLARDQPSERAVGEFTTELSCIMMKLATLTTNSMSLAYM